MRLKDENCEYLECEKKWVFALLIFVGGYFGGFIGFIAQVYGDIFGMIFGVDFVNLITLSNVWHKESRGADRGILRNGFQ